MSSAFRVWIANNRATLLAEYGLWAGRPENDYNPDGCPGFDWWAYREWRHRQEYEKDIASAEGGS